MIKYVIFNINFYFKNRIKFLFLYIKVIYLNKLFYFIILYLIELFLI